MIEQISTSFSLPSLRRSESKNKTAPLQTFGDRYLRYVNILRFVLPVVLFVISTGFELYEHWGTIVLLDVQLLGETLIFGVLGPILVFTWLSYIGVLLKKVNLANKKMAVLNQSLERQVAERTAALAQRNAELAKANTELARMNTELKRVDQIKSDFVALVSHELRAPLTSLNGALEMTLQSQHAIPEPSRRVLDVMADETRRLTRFVQTILDLSRLEAGKFKFNSGLVAIRLMLARSVSLSLGHTDRPIVWRTEHHIPPVWGDEVYLEKVVRNLLVNADKYTPPGAQIEVHARRSTTAPQQLEISIVDHGKGIPATAQAHIFDRFYRHKSADGGVAPGWGLGLYFARALTEAQGGKLTVTSPVHADEQFPGTQFTLLLPIAEEAPEDD